MAPRMRIETGGNSEPERQAIAAKTTPAASAPKPSAPAPKAKVEVPTEAGKPAEGAPAAVAVSPAAVGAVSASKPAVGGPKPAPASRPQVKVAPVADTIDAEDVEGSFEFVDDSVSGKAETSAASAPAGTTKSDPGEGAQPKPRMSVTGWVHSTFPGHEHAFWGAMLAIVVALLTFAIGLPRMMLVAILVFIGITFGQVLDGDPKIIRTIRDLFSSDRER